MPVRQGDQGATLIELLATVVIMSMGIVGILGGLLALTQNADRTDRLTTAANAAQGYAEQLKGPLDEWEYRDCATAADGAIPYPPFEGPAARGLEANVVDVDYLAGLSPSGAITWMESCPSPDGGLQRLTVEVATGATLGPAAERVTLIKRDARCDDYSPEYENPDRGPC